MLVATAPHSLHGQQLRDHHHHHQTHITKQRREWKMDDHRSRRQRYAAPYSMPPSSSSTSSSTMDNSLVFDESMFYTPSGSFAPMPDQVHVPDYLSYNVNNQLDPSYFPTQSYLSQPTPSQYYTNTQSNQQYLHPSHVHSSSSSHHHSHHRHQSYQDNYDQDLDYDLDYDLSHSHHSHSPSPTPSTHSNTSPSSNTKDLTLYGTPSPTHPGAWHCAYPSCTSPALFRRGCDLRKHYNRHQKHLFCRVDDACPQSNPEIPGAGFSSKKDRDRHEAKHNPGIACEWAGEGCERVFSRVDNMKDHVRRIHLKG
ncbi:hypothetical protein BJX70DRAFT_332741 [Aspergillus crustosus]